MPSVTGNRVTTKTSPPASRCSKRGSALRGVFLVLRVRQNGGEPGVWSLARPVLRNYNNQGN